MKEEPQVKIKNNSFSLKLSFILSPKLLKNSLLDSNLFLLNNVTNISKLEINRLFRTNRFNLIKRRHEKDALMKQFPSLKDPTNKQKLTLQAIINKIP